MKRKSIDDIINVFKKIKIDKKIDKKRKNDEISEANKKRKKNPSKKRKADFEYYKYTKKFKMSDKDFIPVYSQDNKSDDFEEPLPELPQEVLDELTFNDLSITPPEEDDRKNFEDGLKKLLEEEGFNTYDQTSHNPSPEEMSSQEDDVSLNFDNDNYDEFNEPPEFVQQPKNEQDYYDDSRYLTQEPVIKHVPNRSERYNLRNNIKKTNIFTPLTYFDKKNIPETKSGESSLMSSITSTSESLSSDDMSVSLSSEEYRSFSSSYSSGSELEEVDTELLTSYKQLCEKTGREVDPLDIVDNISLKNSMKSLRRALKTEHKYDIATEEKAMIEDSFNNFGSDEDE